MIFWCFWIKTKAQKKGTEIDSYFGKHPTPPIGRLLRGADLPPFVTERWRQKCPQGTFVGIGRRFSLSAGVVTRCFSPCLIFWCFWIKTKAHKKEYAPQKKSILRKEFRRQDRLRRICGPKAVGHAHGGGLRRRRLQPARRKGPQYFKPDCGVSQGRNLACTARCSVNSRKVRSSRRFPPVPLRSDRHAPRHTEGQQTYRKEHTPPPDKQREPFPMKRFPFSFPRRIPPDPA